MNDKLKRFMSGNVGYMAVGIMCTIYMASSFIKITETGKTIEQIVAEGLLFFVMGILINRLLDVQGIIIGSKDPRVFETMKLHNQIVDRIYPVINQLDKWCDEKNAEALARARRNYLSRYGMHYDNYFEADGTAREFIPKNGRGIVGIFKEFARYRRFRHAAGIKLTQISSGLLISDAGEENDVYAMGRSKSQYLKAVTKKDVLTKSLTAFLIGYFGVERLMNFSWENMIWTALQVGVLVGMGVVSMFSSIIFVTDEYRGRIIKKIDVLQQFEISIKQEEKKHEHHQKNEITAGELSCGEPERGAIGGAEPVGQALRSVAESAEPQPRCGGGEG